MCACGDLFSLIGRDASGDATHTEMAQVEVVVNMIAEQLLKRKPRFWIYRTSGEQA